MKVIWLLLLFGAGLALAFGRPASAQGPPAFVRGMAAQALGNGSNRPFQALQTRIYVRQRTPSSVDIVSSRDVSNVGVRYYDGSTQRFENLSGRQLTIAGVGDCAGKPIATVWVKSGPNFSGDGPGLGQRFDMPVGRYPPRDLAIERGSWEKRRRTEYE